MQRLFAMQTEDLEQNNCVAGSTSQRGLRQFILATVISSFANLEPSGTGPSFWMRGAREKVIRSVKHVRREGLQGPQDGSQDVSNS